MCQPGRDSSRVPRKPCKSRSCRQVCRRAIFAIKANQHTAARTVATLWQREGGHWKLISYDVDPEIDRSRVQICRAAVAARRAVGIRARRQGDGQGRLEFHEGGGWSEECREALARSLPEFSRASRCTVRTTSRPRRRPRRRAHPAQDGDGERSGSDRLGETLRPARSSAAEAHHQALKLVKHAEDAAFVVCIRPWIHGSGGRLRAPQTRWGIRISAAHSDRPPAGNYAAGFNFSNGNTDPATLWTVWSNVNGLVEGRVACAAQSQPASALRTFFRFERFSIRVERRCKVAGGHAPTPPPPPRPTAVRRASR